MRRTDKLRLGAIEQHRAGWRSVNAELLLDPQGAQAVRGSERSVVADTTLRCEKERNAFRPFRRVGQARQNEMDDVLGHVVLAPGDEDFLSEQRMAPIGTRLSPGPERPQIRSRLWLGEVHGAGPPAAHDMREIERLLTGIA